MGSNLKKYTILGGIGALLILILIVVGLYVLGDEDQSALERLRDIAVIFIVLLFSITVVLLAAITAGLGFLLLQMRDRVIPMLEELTGTAKRIRGTADFMTEEAVKPMITVASQFAKMRAMTRVVTGKSRKVPKI